MKGLFVRIDEDLDGRLTHICEQEGYKKTGLITKLIRDFLNQHPASRDPIREAQEFGIDTTLLASSLEKTPTERLRDHAHLYAFIQEAKKAGKRR